MSPDILELKVCVLQVILNWSKWILVVDIPTKILLTPLKFIALVILQKVLISREKVLFCMSYHILFQFTKIDQLITLW